MDENLPDPEVQDVELHDVTGHAAAAVLRWPHRRGGAVQCLVQLRRGVPAGGTGPGALVVVSELRDNPRGLGLTTDVLGWAGVVLDHVVPRSVAPEQIRWFIRHGWYSSHDPTGPETLTEVELGWDGKHVVDHVARHRLLPREEAGALAARWRLEPVDVALAALGQPGPRRAGPQDQGDLTAPPWPRRRMAASMLLTDPTGAMLIVEPTYKPGWEIPGGAVEDGESPRAGVVREVAEELGDELGATCPPGRLLVVDHVPAAGPRTEGLIVVFDGGQVNDPAAVVLARDELRSFAFVAPDRLGEFLPPLQTRRALAALRARTEDTTAYLEDGHPVNEEPSAGTVETGWPMPRGQA